MNVKRQRTIGKPSEGGYALLLVVFLVTVLLVSTMAVRPNILTEGQREKEKEMIWRGKQYTRGVKLYYRKMGRFPTSLDDLTKPKVGSLRFIRQAYKDPMNKEDGSWRLIYVGPAGQLIGSLRPRQQNLRLPQAGGSGGPVNPPAGAGAVSQPGAIGPQGQAGTPPAGATSATNPAGITGAPVGSDQSDSEPNPQQFPLGDTPTPIGGNIIGVGSKVNRRSIITYDRANNYRLFEFIWDPSKDAIGPGQPGMQTGTGLGQQPGQNPSNPPQNPQQPTQNPPQQP